jgi:predicted transcriptional regulator
MPDNARPSPPPVTVTVEIDAEDHAFLEEMASNMGIAESELLRDALRGYVAWQRHERELTEQAIREVDAGLGVHHDRVVAWVQSWGTSAEQPRPE